VSATKIALKNATKVASKIAFVNGPKEEKDNFNLIEVMDSLPETTQNCLFFVQIY